MDNSNDHPATNNDKGHVDVLICGMNLSQLPRSTMFITCVLGIFISYICYGALQEMIFHNLNMRQHAIYLTFFQFLIYAVLSYCELRFQHIALQKTGFHLYCLLAMLSLGTICFSNMSLGYLNYPTQLIFKCCKMIPVMIGSVLIQKKHYGFLQVLAVLLMTIGLICFTLVDVTIQPEFNVFGVFLISIALCCDGVLGNMQEFVMQSLKCSNTEILFYSYSTGCSFLLVGILVSGNLIPSAIYFAQNPWETYGYGFVFSICGYFGVQFVLCLVQSYGALTAVTVTTFRKAVSMIISFTLFEKAFSVGYVWSSLLVVFGLYLNVYSKHRQSWNQYIVKQLQNYGIIRITYPSPLPV